MRCENSRVEVPMNGRKLVTKSAQDVSATFLLLRTPPQPAVMPDIGHYRLKTWIKVRFAFVGVAKRRDQRATMTVDS
jgi:hypothetical protein